MITNKPIFRKILNDITCSSNRMFLIIVDMFCYEAPCERNFEHGGATALDPKIILIKS